MTCAVCGHSRAAHKHNGCDECGHFPFVEPRAVRPSSLAMVLVRGGYDARRLCGACGHPADSHQRHNQTPPCVICQRSPDSHQPGHPAHAYRAPPPDGECHRCDWQVCLKFSDAPQVETPPSNEARNV